LSLRRATCETALNTLIRYCQNTSVCRMGAMMEYLSTYTFSGEQSTLSPPPVSCGSELARSPTNHANPFADLCKPQRSIGARGPRTRKAYATTAGAIVRATKRSPQPKTSRGRLPV
jgi:hypothetical protein